jgi:hypothetical protein
MFRLKLYIATASRNSTVLVIRMNVYINSIAELLSVGNSTESGGS